VPLVERGTEQEKLAIKPTVKKPPLTHQKRKILLNLNSILQANTTGSKLQQR
jgi:hypothetical protein